MDGSATSQSMGLAQLCHVSSPQHWNCSTLEPFPRGKSWSFTWKGKAVPGRTGSCTLELLFLQIGPAAPPDPWRPQDSCSPQKVQLPHLPPSSLCCHYIQVRMDKLTNPTKDAAQAVLRPNYTWGHLTISPWEENYPKPLVLSVG